MPYFNDQFPNLKLPNETIQRGAVLLLELYQSNSINLLTVLEDLYALTADKKPQHDHTNDDSSFFNLLMYTIESKAHEKEFLRKYELIKFLQSTKIDPQVSVEEFAKFYTFVYLNQDSLSQDFLNNLMESDFSPVIINALMGFVPGYLFVKEALPQLIFNFYKPANLKDDLNKNLPSVAVLKSLGHSVAAQLNEDLLLDLSEHSFTSVYSSSNGKSSTILQTKKVNRRLDFDAEVEMGDPGAINAKPIPPVWSSRAKKAYIQLFLFKRIASDPRVMAKKNEKLFQKSQEAIEKICTLITNYAEPHVKSAYEDQHGFKIDKFAHNHLNFWNSLSEDRLRKTELSQQISRRLEGNVEISHSVGQLIHSDYTEIHDHSDIQSYDVKAPKQFNKCS
jgi:hypothetical protein